MAQENVLYVETDDDITSVIAKVGDLSPKTIRIVVPKRSTLFQSIINVKLLKKSVLHDGKKIAFVTQDPILKSMAANAEIPVAPDLETQPVLPTAKVAENDIPDDHIDAVEASDEEIVEDDVVDEPDSPDDLEAEMDEEPVTVTEETIEDESGELMVAEGGEKVHDVKKHKVPNFERFKRRVFMGIGGIFLLGIGYIVVSGMFPNAEVIVRANAERLDTTFTSQVSTDVTADGDRSILATEYTTTETVADSFAATDELDKGKRANGTVTITNCSSSNSIIVAAGTRFVAYNAEVAYVTLEDHGVPGSTFNDTGNGPECQEDGSVTVSVEAENSGEAYNIASEGMQIDSLPATVTAFGSEMGGGSSEVVSVVSQTDVDNARASAIAQAKTRALEELQARVGGDEIFLAESLSESIVDVTFTPDVGSEADTAQVVLEIRFTAASVPRANLRERLLSEQQQQLLQTGSTQTVIDSGIDQASIVKSEGEGAYTVTAVGTVGPNIDMRELKDVIAGKEASEAKNILNNYEQITDVDISLKPFWAFSMPSNIDNISLSVDVPGINE